jgi:hypothetical protein
MVIYKDGNGLTVDAMDFHAGRAYDIGRLYRASGPDLAPQLLAFQAGPVPANGVNGLTNEALLVLLIHRTQALDRQSPCDENKAAMASMHSALEAFERRTAGRAARGVEGTHAP